MLAVHCMKVPELTPAEVARLKGGERPPTAEELQNQRELVIMRQQQIYDAAQAALKGDRVEMAEGVKIAEGAEMAEEVEAEGAEEAEEVGDGAVVDLLGGMKTAMKRLLLVVDSAIALGREPDIHTSDAAGQEQKSLLRGIQSSSQKTKKDALRLEEDARQAFDRQQSLLRSIQSSNEDSLRLEEDVRQALDRQQSLLRSIQSSNEDKDT